jgi:hypothetical protein
MTIKIKVSGLKDIEKRYKKLPSVAARAAKQVLDAEIVTTIERGVSPERGIGRFDRYEQSYRDALSGKATFFKKNGKLLVPTKGRSRSTNRFIKTRNQQLYGNKKRSPVNLKLTGELLKSYFSKIKPRGVIEISFKDFKADIHTNQGVGPKKTKRPLLPRNGKSFNLNIQRKLIDTITKQVTNFLG